MGITATKAPQGFGPASWLCLALAVLTLALGLWQWDRSLEKTALAARVSESRAASATPFFPGQAQDAFSRAATQDLDRRLATLVGRWRDDKTIYLDNRAHDGAPGVHVLTPMILADGSLAWVNRGWAPKAPGATDPRRTAFEAGQLHRPTPGPGPVQLEAVAMASLMRRLELRSDAADLRSGALWQNFDSAAARDWLGPDKTGEPTRTWSVIFWQTSETGDGLLRRIPTPDREDIAKHEGYALQWWLMSLVALVFAWRLRRSTNAPMP
jgi:surfeit locus 1 family protein